MLPIPLWIFVVAANSAVHFGLVLIFATVVSLARKKDLCGLQRRLWKTVFFAPPVFLALNILLPSIVVPILSLPEKVMRVVPIAAVANAENPGGAFPALVTPVFSPLITWIAAIGFLGTIGSILHLAFGLAAAHRIGKQADFIGNDRILRWGREAALRMGCRRPVTLKTSRQIAVPAVLGLFRPIIILPPNFLAWPEAELKPVLDHEMSHVKHRDPLGRTLARAVCAFNWFNPAAWMALRRLVVEQEITGDRASVSSGARPSDYAEILMKHIVAKDARRRFSLASFGDGGALKKRMRALLQPEVPSRTQRKKRITATALVASMVLAPGVFNLWDVAAASPRTVTIERRRPSGGASAPERNVKEKTRIWMDSATHQWDWF